MFCKECGTEFENEVSSVCLNCGTKKGNGKKYCDNCGTVKKSENQDVCLSCGKDFKKIFGNNSKSSGGSSDKTKLVTLILWLLLGAIGVHCFYAGKNGRGILILSLTLLGFLTCGITSIASAILMIIDIVQLLTDKFEDGNGAIINQWS